MTKRPKRPRDPAQLAKFIVDVATGQVQEPAPKADTPAQEFARKGGLKGGKARAATLTSQQRRAIAQNAAKRRWGSKLK